MCSDVPFKMTPVLYWRFVLKLILRVIDGVLLHHLAFSVAWKTIAAGRSFLLLSIERDGFCSVIWYNKSLWLQSGLLTLNDASYTRFVPTSSFLRATYPQAHSKNVMWSLRHLFVIQLSIIEKYVFYYKTKILYIITTQHTLALIKPVLHNFYHLFWKKI